jgi:LysM repeat protein
MKPTTDPACLLLTACLLFPIASTSPLNIERDQSQSSISTEFYTSTTWIVSVVTVTGDDTTPTSSASLPPNTTGNSACTKNHTVVSGDSCSQIATQHGVAVDQILAWNPWITGDCEFIMPGWVLCVEQSQSASSPSSVGVSITYSSVPVISTPISSPVATNEALPTPAKTGCSKTYTVQAGDFCDKIASAFGLTEDLILSLNSGLNGNCELIEPGWVLCVGQSSLTNASTTTSIAVKVRRKENEVSCTKKYVVQSGDYCDAIAKAYGITIQDIISWNSASLTHGTCELIQPGVSLWVVCSSSPPSYLSNLTTLQPPSPTAATGSTCAKSHTVVLGDYCYAIAESYGTTTNQILALNPWLNGTCTNLKPGWNICLQQNSATTPAILNVIPTTISSGAICAKTHTVAIGDSCYEIAKANNVTTDQIIAWNAFLNGSCEKLQPGQKLCLSGDNPSMATPTTVTTSAIPSTTQP